MKIFIKLQKKMPMDCYFDLDACIQKHSNQGDWKRIIFSLEGWAELGRIAQWVGVKALRLGEASVIGNIEYIKLIYAAIFGYFLFNEIPNSYTITGSLIIVSSSTYMLHSEALQKKK